jgi:YD repeat-containing protein
MTPGNNTVLTPHQGTHMNHSHRLSRRTIAAAMAALQIIPAGLLPAVLPALAHAQQTNATTYGYDAQGNLTQITDPNSKVTTQTPDSLDRITSQTLPAPTASAFTHSQA